MCEDVEAAYVVMFSQGNKLAFNAGSTCEMLYVFSNSGGGGGVIPVVSIGHMVYMVFMHNASRQYTLMPLVHNPMHSCLHSALFCGTHTLRAHVYRLCAPCSL